MAEESGFVIAGPEEVEAVLRRMAASVRALVGEADDAGPLCLVGIRRRGVPLAERLSRALAERTGRPVEVGELALKRYADDLTVLHETPRLEASLDLEVDGRTVLAVDDVLYSGRTLFRAVQLLVEEGASRVHTAVLCSRGGNEVPVHADVTGRRLDVGERNVIEVHAPPYEERLGVVLRHREDVGG